MSKEKNNAIVSVYDKTDLNILAKGLTELDWQLFASGGTAIAMRETGAEVADVSILTKGKEFLDGRVKTLSRGVHAGLLAKDTPKDWADLRREHARWLELACVNPYDLAKYMADSSLTYEQVLEMFDVGGPAMINAGIKGQRVVVTSPDQYSAVLDWLREGRPDDEEFRQELYIAAARVLVEDSRLKLQHLGGPAVFSFVGEKVVDLKYGTNPHQKNAEVYTSIGSNNPLSMKRFEKLQGTDLSATNEQDIGHALTAINRIAAAYERNYGKVPYIGVGGKHTNPCGASIGKTPEQAIINALEGDLLSIFGGAVMFNFPIDEALATLLVRHARAETDKNRLLDVVVAPEVSEEALKILVRAKENKLRVVVNPALAHLSEATINQSRTITSLGDSVVVEDAPTFIWDYKAPEMEVRGEPTEQQLKDALLAWAVGSMTFSNTVTIAKDGMILANAAGQQSRVDAARVAIARAKNREHDLAGATAYTDSFFPFADAAAVLMDAQITAIIGTLGSDNPAALEAIEKRGIAFLTMPDALARGFRH